MCNRFTLTALPRAFLAVVLGLLSAGAQPSSSPVRDLSHLAWPEAFDEVVETLRLHYPLTEHKGIDWAAVRLRFRPEFERAEHERDTLGAYTALRRFATQALADGHVSVATEEAAAPLASVAFTQAVGGHYGLDFALTDDGRLLLVGLDAQASAAGLEWGAEVRTLQGKSVAEALAQVDLTWFATLANREYRGLARELCLSFGPPGSTLQLEARNPGQSTWFRSTLAARETQECFPALERSVYARNLTPMEGTYQHELRGDGLAVLRLQAMMPAEAFKPGVTEQEVLAAGMAMVQDIQQFVLGLEARGARGLIVDLRGNQGGSDLLCAALAGVFTEQGGLYYKAEQFVPNTGNWTVQETLMVSPLGASYRGPLAVLVDPATISAGEGFARWLSQRPQAKVLGFFGSNASFCNIGGALVLKGGFGLEYPIQRCVDAEGQVLLDSEGTGVGGVVPTVRVPRTASTLRALCLEGRDPVFERAVVELEALAYPVRGLGANRVLGLSSRAMVGSGERVGILGFTLEKETSVLLRAIGPSLRRFGIGNPVENPNLRVHRQEVFIASNEDWGRSVELEALGAAVGAFPVSEGAEGDREAMLCLRLPPGQYTAMMADDVPLVGKEENQGRVGLLEAYLLED